MLFPLPLIFALLLQETSIVLEIVLTYPMFTLLSLTLSASLLVVVFRVVRPQFYFEGGSASILLVSLLGLLLYVYGSSVGEFSLHWFSLPLIYLGFAAYLAGRRATAFVVPGLIAIALLPLPTYVSSFLVDLVTILALSTIALSAIPVVRFKKSNAESCDYCKTFVGNGRTFCDYCGKNLCQVRLELSGRRLLKLIAASFFVILFLTLSVTSIALSSSGIYVAQYSLAGRGSQPLLSSGVLRDSLKSFSSNSTLTTLEYSLRGSHEINATISISPSPSLSFKGAIARHEGAKQNGSIAIAPNQSGTLFSWRQGRTSVTGLLLSANLHYLSSGLVQQGYATFLISEDSSGFDRNRGKDVVSLSQNVEMGLRTAQQFDPFVVDVLGPALSYDQYVLPATSVTFFGIVAGMARSMDFSNARKFDNSLGLDEREFALLASLSALKGMFTGSDLLITNGVVHEWQTLSALLEKLSWLGIMERRIGTEGGSPRILWKCVVA